MRAPLAGSASCRRPRALAALLAAVVLGCTSTPPSPSTAISAPPSTGGSLPSASIGPGSPSTGVGPPGPGNSAPSSFEVSPSGVESPGPSAVPGAFPTPDPDYVIPDWEPWPALDPGAPSVIVQQGPRLPVIALTIDDGNFPDGCRQEFGYLSANHIPATFFPDWVGVNRDHQLWRQIAAAGYPIGNHTLTHLGLAGSTVTDHTVQRQLGGAKRKIEAIIGRSMIPVWRPPYGAYDARDLRIAGALGLHTMVLWSATDADSAAHSQAAAMIHTALQAGRGDILLTHCNSQRSADILPSIVQGLLAKGLTFVTIPDLLRPHGLGG
jgi:peptidoglycan/xylan/chitin deacetylase (PgdA/CDA1 family)